MTPKRPHSRLSWAASCNVAGLVVAAAAVLVQYASDVPPTG